MDEVTCNKCACQVLRVHKDSHADWHARQEKALQAMMDLIENHHNGMMQLVNTFLKTRRV